MTREVTNESPWITPLYLLLFSAIAVVVIMLLVRFGQKDLTVAIHDSVEGVAREEIREDVAREHNRAVNVIELPYDQVYDRDFEQLGEENSRYDVIMLDDPWMPALAEKEGKQKGLDPVRFKENECNPS